MRWLRFAILNALRNRRRSLVTVSIAALGTAAILLAGGFPHALRILEAQHGKAMGGEGLYGKFVADAAAQESARHILDDDQGQAAIVAIIRRQY